MGKIRVSRFDTVEPQNRLDTTARDRAMIERIYQRGFLNTTQLVTLFSDPDRYDPRNRAYSGQQYRAIASRLRKLQNHQFISTLEAQRRVFLQDFDNDSKVYVITDKAVPILRTMGYIVPKTNYTELAKTRKLYQHDLNISEVYTRFVLAAKARHLRYRSYKEVIEATKGAEQYPFKPKKWELFRYATEHGILEPDDLFTLGDKEKLLFFEEVDRNNEQNIHADDKKTIRIMLEKYMSLYRNKERIAPYGVEYFRVLIVTTSEQHITNIIKLLDAFEGEIFHFTTFHAIKTCADILALEWRTNKNNFRTLV